MIRVGILGAGSIARQRHAHEYYLNPHAEIAGVFDLNAARAKEVVEKYGGKVYASMEEMLADPAVDAVSVCVANKYHAECTIAALNAGKHVLCEKPMAVSLEECEAMVAAAKKNNRRLCIGQNQRLTPAHKRAKQIIASGELGKVISFQSTFGHRGPESWSIENSANTWFFKKDQAAFGSMADLGIHKIDLLCYLIGDVVDTAYARLMTLHKTFEDGTPIEVDDNSVEILTFKKGTIGTVTTSWTHYGEECNATVLYCEKGIVRLYSDPKYSLQIVYADGTKAHFELDVMQTNEDAQQTSSGVIDTFIEGIRTGEPTILDADDILNSMRVVFACLRSSETGKTINLSR
ncbi:Gfo/Idh/MocA family oxidoreductase [Christensenellaceae bacterium OttesenSCG-928-L17]|nr:Gfo/Idh/MocA family oxidoreductase [Christensenellaceae bacterium OttesenSCG-928-L17]